MKLTLQIIQKRISNAKIEVELPSNGSSIIDKHFIVDLSPSTRSHLVFCFFSFWNILLKSYATTFWIQTFVWHCCWKTNMFAEQFPHKPLVASLQPRLHISVRSDRNTWTKSNLEMFESTCWQQNWTGQTYLKLYQQQNLSNCQKEY